MMQGIRQVKGTVLVTVILMVAVAALIATDIAYRQKLDVLRTSAFLARDSAFQYLMAAENLGLYALKRDQDDDKNQKNQNANQDFCDDLGEGWNKHVAVPIPNGIGTIEGQLYDLQGRFNINSLLATDPRDKALFQNAFIQILTNVQRDHPDVFDDSVTPQMLQQRVSDWLDPDSDPTALDGKEDDDYLKLKQPYRAANHFITDLSELMLIDGFTPRSVAFLDEYLSFLPSGAQVNLMTADQDLLVAYGFDAGKVAEFTSAQRPQQFGQDARVKYNTVADVINFLGGNQPVEGGGQTPPQTATQTIDPVTGAVIDPGQTGTDGKAGRINPDLFSISSEYFLLKGKAVVNGKPVLIESVIWRPEAPVAGAGPQPGAGANRAKPMKTILRKLVDPLKQV